jgi:rod shape-determining protein MreD
MARSIIWTVIFGFVAVILQSTLLSRLTLYGAVPDLALGIIVYSAYVNGTMTGQVSGFLYGIVQDLLSAAPLGLNAFVRTFIGALTGLMKGTFFLGAILLPMILCALATLVKAVMLLLLSLLFSGVVKSYSLTEPILWAELALNTLSAPLLFAFLKRFSLLLAERRKA